MPPYATEEELAAALHIRVTNDNKAGLRACLAAAQAEIDHDVDWIVPAEDPHYPEGDPKLDLLNRVNIARGAEWWKANDAAFGVLGYDTTALRVPRDGFNRYAIALTPCKQLWGVA